ncbi:hypothetical protein CC77DRAFT_502093 [Alternaria alternata]|uniref:Uncharacterized protein n=1 Tax=Alternaria alternata TaxID=5599 RepID=A0A177D715_ALTAL|nr:hypothetical protein CC77DRAFT_502093 [Alternaria alternata]OAG14892.1 hypothetical protein CC77DRAFT_502093 [Alternaria alternata]
MAANLTQITTTAKDGQPWSREAIFALVSIFIMVLLSSIGLACKHCLKSPNRWTVSRWRRLLMNNEELARIHVRPTMSGWVDIVNVRQYQQDTYTSLLRMRRGPRLSRSSSRITEGRRR